MCKKEVRLKNEVRIKNLILRGTQTRGEIWIRLFSGILPQLNPWERLSEKAIKVIGYAERCSGNLDDRLTSLKEKFPIELLESL